MLHQETDYRYIVYPSWMVLGHHLAWDELPWATANPIETGLLDFSWPGLREVYEDIVRQPDPAVYMKGPFGGGVIVLPTRPTMAEWLIGKEAGLVGPLVQGYEPKELWTDVAWIEEQPGKWDIGARPRHTCLVTVEDCPEAGDDVYWLIDMRGGDLPDRVHADIQLCASSFGLRADLVDAPLPVLDSVRRWLPDSLGKKYWWRIHCDTGKLGICYSSMIYTAFHLRKRLRKVLRAVYLIAQVEGQPRRRSIGRP